MSPNSERIGSSKKQRLALACSVCKKRKVKCDKGTPCSSCVRHKAPESCKYPDPAVTQELDMPNISINQYKRPPGATVLQNRFLMPPIIDSRTYNLSGPKFSIIPQHSAAEQSMIQSSQHTNHQFSNQFAPIPVPQTVPNQDAPSPAFGDLRLQNEIESLKDKIKNIEAVIRSSGNTIHPTDAPKKLNSDGVSSGPGVSKAPLWDRQLYENPISYNMKHDPMGNFEKEDKKNGKSSDPFKIYGPNPIYSSECEINFFKGYTPLALTSAPRANARIINRGPFFWVTMIKLDASLRMIWNSMSTQKHHGEAFKIDSQGDYKAGSDGQRENEEFRLRLMETEGIEDLKPYKDKKKHCKLIRKSKESACPMKPQGATMHLELSYITKLKHVLPKKKVVWLLVDRFFDHIYPFMPFIDEKDFRNSISKIIGTKELADNKISCLKIEKRLDFAHMGILIIILRLSYLSYISNNPVNNERNLNNTDPSEKSRNIKYLLENPVDSDIIQSAQECLAQFKMRRTSMLILQCSLFIKLYNIFAPEDGDGADGGESQISSGILIQMANSIGLNRDPDNFPETSSDFKLSNLWRKIWFQMRCFDTTEAALIGSPIVMNDRFFDTRVPSQEKASAHNVNNPIIEQCALDNMTRVNEINTKIMRVLDILLDINKAANLKELGVLLTDLEHYLREKYVSLSHILTLHKETDSKSDDINKVNSVLQYLYVKNFINSIYFYFFNYYEDRNIIDLAYFYLKKLLVLNHTEILPYCLDLMLGSEKYFGEGFDLILTPTIEITYHRSILIAMGSHIRIGVFLRAVNHYHENDASSSFFGLLFKFQRTAMKYTKAYTNEISKISNRYYYAWKMSRAHRYIYSIIEEECFYHKNDSTSKGTPLISLAATNIYEKLNNFQVEELISILEVVDLPQDYAPSLTRSKTGSHRDSPINASSNGQNTDGNLTSSKPMMFKDEEAEIDALWIQVLANSNENLNNLGKTTSVKGVTGENDALGNLRQGDNLSSINDLNYFDIFSDIPLEHLYNLSEYTIPE